jgi:trans-aconitate 2-methyltransferase
MDTWSPTQYEKFRREREQPFHDLLSLVRPAPSMRVVDLGCGTGKQTRILHERLAAAETIGIDRSAKMLEGAPSDVPGLSFRTGTIEGFVTAGAAYAEDGVAPPHHDLIFSNAALHWVEHHDALIRRLAQLLKAGGQLAFQVPASHGEVTHRAAEELTTIEPFRSAFKGWARAHPVLTPEAYASLLYDNGFAEQQVRLVVYPHVLDGPEDVVEWMKGTLLTEYERHLPSDLREAFVDAYRAMLLDRLGQTRPFFFPFPRILCWARKGAQHG